MFEKLIRRIQKKAEIFTTSGTEVLFQKVRISASLTDHSLKDLRRLNHPYSTSAAGRLHPMNLVHRQSSTLYDSIKKETTLSWWRKVGRVYIDTSQAPYAKYVLFGTSYMKSRDFLHSAYNNSLTDLKKEVRKTFKG